MGMEAAGATFTDGDGGSHEFATAVGIVAEENRTGRCRCGVDAGLNNTGCAVHEATRARLAARADLAASQARLLGLDADELGQPAAPDEDRLAAQEAHDDLAAHAAALQRDAIAPLGPVPRLRTEPARLRAIAPLGPVPRLRTEPARLRAIASDPELYDGLTITGPQLGAQMRAYGPAGVEVRLALAVLPDAWESTENHSGRPIVEISAMQAVRLRDLLNIATARGYL